MTQDAGLNKVALVELTLDNGQSVKASITVEPSTAPMMTPTAAFSAEFRRFMDYFIASEETQTALKGWLEDA